MAKTFDEKIIATKEKITQYENQYKQLIQKQKVEERKARTKRLIERGAILESLIAEASTLTNEQIKAFLEKAITDEYARKTLSGLKGQNAEPSAHIPVQGVQQIGAGVLQTEGSGTRQNS